MRSQWRSFKRVGICLTLIVCVLGLCACEKTPPHSLTGASTNAAGEAKPPLHEKELIEKINRMTVEESNPLTSEDLMQVCGDLYEKAETLTDEDLLRVLENETMTPITKSTLIQMADRFNDGQGLADPGAFEKFIPQKTVPEDVRVDLIETLDMSSDKNKDMLETIVRTEEGRIVVRSLFALERTDARRALNIAKNIVANAADHNEYAIRVAVMVLSDYYFDLRQANSPKDVSQEVGAYIRFCMAQFEASNDDVFKDAVIFSLNEIMDFRAVKAVLTNDRIDDGLKRNCISNNSRTFAEVIQSNPSKEDVDLIISAMERVPLSELKDLMREKLASNPQYQSARLDNVLTVMEIRGVPTDEKRKEKKPNPAWLD